MKSKKQWIALLIALVLLATGLPFATASAASQSGDCGENATWALDADGLLTISGSGDMADYATEEEVPWASLRDQIKAAEIAVGITGIANYAFNECTALESVAIPNTITSIGEWAFNNCAALQSVAIPNSVTDISWYAFFGCTGLKEVSLPNNVQTLGDSVFSQCSNLSSVKLPENLTTLGYYLFSGCTSLSAIEIPKSVTEIGGGAFYGCTSLISVDIPKNVTVIGDLAFQHCRKLERVAIFNGACELPEGANVFPAATVLCGYEVSTTHDYAIANERTFEMMIEIPEHDHIWENPTVTKAATCTEEGVLTSTCPICQETQEEPIPMIDHTPTPTPAVAANCQMTGLTVGSHCSVCGAVLTAQAILPKTGHTWKDKVTKAKIGENGKIVSTCKVCGATKTTKLYKINTVKLSATSFIADGTAKKPTVTVKDANNKTLKSGTDYTLTYSSGRKAVGVYTVKVTFKGNYSGSKTLKFKILPGQVTNLKVTPQAGRKFKFTWNKVTGAKKYTVYFATSKNGTYYKLGTTSKTTFTDGGFTAGRTYYFKVRALATVDGTNHFGAYSLVKHARARW